MVGAVGQVLDADVHHRVAGLDAGAQGLLDPLLDGGDELARDRAALDLVHEVEALLEVAGSTLITTWPNWPRPPVWRTKRPSTFSVRSRIVSR